MGLKAGPQKAWQLLTELGTLRCFPTAYYAGNHMVLVQGLCHVLPSRHLRAHTLSSAKPEVAQTHVAEGAARFPPGEPDHPPPA